MSSVVRPKGPLPPSVYWRRRLIVLGVVVAVIIVLVIIFLPRGGASEEEGGGGASPTGSSTSTASPTPSASSTGTGECNPTKVEITADTDKNEYNAGELPQLWFTLENKSAAPCTMEIGGTDTLYVITSPSGDGDEQYWSTADCANPNEESVVITLQPGTPVASDAISWPRTRSTPGDCAQTAPQVGGEGASFDFTVSLGTLSASKRIYLY